MFTSNFERQTVLICDELRQFPMHGVVHVVRIQTDQLVADTQVFEIRFAAFDHVGDEKADAVFDAATQREAEREDGRMSNECVPAVVKVWSYQLDGADARVWRRRR